MRDVSPDAPVHRLHPFAGLERQAEVQRLRGRGQLDRHHPQQDRKSTRLNSSHVAISYAVFCLKKNNCYALNRALTHRLVTPILETSYIVVKISVGNRKQNLDMMTDYGLAVVRGIPAIAIL